MRIPFTYTLDADNPRPIQLRLGLATTQGKGAAENTRLYIDNLCLYSQDNGTEVGIHAPSTLNTFAVDYSNVTQLYDLAGRPARPSSLASQKGIFITSGGKKIVK